MRLEEQLTDKVDALGDRRGEAQAALDRLYQETQLQLFVVFVESFDGMPSLQWAERTAAISGLGDRDALLAVATGDRSYAYTVDQNFPLTDAQLSEVAATAIEPALAANDWAGAVVGAADGYRAALAGQPVQPPAIVPGDPDPGGGWRRVRHAGRRCLRAGGAARHRRCARRSGWHGAAAPRRRRRSTPTTPTRA